MLRADPLHPAVGATLLALGYQLFMGWVAANRNIEASAPAPDILAPGPDITAPEPDVTAAL